MKRQFLNIDLDERKRILELHNQNKPILQESYVINENIGGILRTLSQGAIRRLEGILLKIPEIAERGFRNLAELLTNWSRLAKGERGKVVTTLFKELSGEQKKQIARIIAQSDTFLTKYVRETEEATRKALRQAGKYTDEEIETLIAGHRLNTTNSLTGSWVGAGQSSANALVRQTSSNVITNFKNALPSTTIKRITQGGSPKLLLPAEENALKTAIIKGAESGGKISWKELMNSLKYELKVTGGITLFLLSAGFYEWLTSQDIEDLPSKNEIVSTGTSTDTSTGKIYELGDRVLRRGTKGKDVEDLQSKLVYYGYNLGNTGPNKNGVDGKFGPKTDEAVRSFQDDAGIKVDGMYGPESHKALMNFNVDQVSFPDDIA